MRLPVKTAEPGSSVTVGSSVPSFHTLLASHAAHGSHSIILYVVHSQSRALQAADELATYLGSPRLSPGDPASARRVEHFPWVEGSVYTDVLPDRERIEERLALLGRLMFGKAAGAIVVAGIESLARRVISPDAYEDRSQILATGMLLDRDELARELTGAGYRRTDVVDEPGTFAIRAKVVDLHPPMYPEPVRIHLWGDEIETISFFDPVTQRRIRETGEVYVHPVRDALLTRTSGLREELYALADEVGHPSTKTAYLLERITEGEEFFGMEPLTPLYHDTMATLADYLPEGSSVIVEDPAAVRQSLDALLAAEEERFRTWKQRGRITVPVERFYAGFDALEESWLHHGVTYIDPAQPSDMEAKGLAPLRTRIHASLSGEGDPISFLEEQYSVWLDEGRTIYLVSPESMERSPIARAARDTGISPEAPEEAGPPQMVPGRGVLFRRGHVTTGFETPYAVLVSEEELFGVRTRRPKRKKARLKAPLTGFEELESGALVVHRIHGIGRYHGLVRKEVGGRQGEFLEIQYADGTYFLPAHRIGELERYRGGDPSKVRLDRMGGDSWKKKKGKVEEKVRALAEELLRMAAERASRPGTSYPVSDPMLLEFEATFPYEETPDQAKAIEEVYSDMASPRAMDRLVCGDVGYGKTEVALRAAFLTVLGGKQVAVLAPTTLLVEQHFRTFSERLAPFPVKVASLSRFTSSHRRKKILEELAGGEIDILVGTHAVLSPDVHFRDLGLLVVDEEQKFGVSQKEKLKMLRQDVDVLTLTATPIPRTLQMSMVGLRDISVITTPPEERQDVRTYVAPMREDLIREAIRREMSRGGQVFAVCPRITGTSGASRTLEDWTRLLEELVPEARMAVLHGRMDNRTMERTMLEFLEGAHDVLVSTNIVESGLDIPRANTLLVFDAHMFGLAQLYQLRGRVGRSRVRAYAYFFIPSFESITPKARRRLQALQHHSGLGAGFNLAVEDLEIRGAGEVLGTRQSGYTATVGFDTFLEIVRDTVRKLQDLPPPAQKEPELDVNLPAFLPDDYVEDPAERLVLYARLSQADGDELESLSQMMEDRFGPLPPQARLLVELMGIKAILRQFGIRGMGLGASRVVFHVDESSGLDPECMIALLQEDKSIRLDSPTRLVARLAATDDPEARLRSVKDVLHTMSRCVKW